VWRAGLFPCVPYRRRRACTSVYIRRRTSTRVDGCTRASTSVDARRATDVDGRRRAGCEWALTDRSFGYASLWLWNHLLVSFRRPCPSLSACDSPLPAFIASSSSADSALTSSITSLFFSLSAYNLPVSQTLPTVDSLPASGLTSRTIINPSVFFWLYRFCFVFTYNWSYRSVFGGFVIDDSAIECCYGDGTRHQQYWEDSSNTADEARAVINNSVLDVKFDECPWTGSSELFSNEEVGYTKHSDRQKWCSRTVQQYKNLHFKKFAIGEMTLMVSGCHRKWR